MPGIFGSRAEWGWGRFVVAVLVLVAAVEAGLRLVDRGAGLSGPAAGPAAPRPPAAPAPAPQK